MLIRACDRNEDAPFAAFERMPVLAGACAGRWDTAHVAKI